MLCHLTGRRPGAILDLTNYELELEDRFEGPVLDRRLWIPYYLPHWSSRAGSAARYAVASGTLRLFIEHVVPVLRKRGRLSLLEGPLTLRERLFPNGGARLADDHPGRHVGLHSSPVART